MKRRIALVGLLCLSFSLVAGSAGATHTLPLAEQVVGTDATGDWGGGGDAALVGHALGQDLLEAKIEMASADVVKFTIRTSWLPSTGGVPEVSRYIWDMQVKTDVNDPGKFVELDGKWTNYSRGTCDPTAGACPPPRDPGQQPFFIRGDCVVGTGNVTTCKELGVVQGTFNASLRTITIPVPTKFLGLAPCSRIAPGANIFGGSVSASPSAFVSSSGAPLDSLEITEDYVIPSEDPVGSPCPEPPPVEEEEV